MAIIYSYPQVPSIENSDLLIATRFENEERGFARTVSFSADTLGSYITSNHSNTLNQVLNAGNESLLDAKIGDLYLWDDTNDAYARITGDKNRINFYGIDDRYYGYIGTGVLRLVNLNNSLGLNIQKPNTVTAERFVTFQDASGTVAYLSDITDYGLAALTTNAAPVANTTTELTLLNGTIVGSLDLLADSFVIGDSFKLSLGGVINASMGNQLFISIKTAGGTILAETGAISMNATTNKKWSLETTLTVRTIGAAATAAIASSGLFIFNSDSGSTISGSAFSGVNSTTFDTTIDNTLVVTARWSTAILDNFIRTQTFTLNKVY